MGLSLARAQRAPERWAPSFHVATGGMETTPHPTSPRSRLLWTWTCPSKFSSLLHHLLQPRVKPTIKGIRGTLGFLCTLEAQVGQEDTLEK